MDTTWADSNDHDIIFGISDGNKFIGFFMVDKDNFAGLHPCHSIEGDKVNNKLSNVVYDRSGPRPSSPRGFSGEVKIQLKPGEKWGSCHTEHDEGFVFITNYQRNLDLTKGLFLDTYRDDAPEIFRIEYITVDAMID